MNYEKAWRMMMDKIEEAQLYESKDPDLNYLVGFVEALDILLLEGDAVENH